MSVTFLDIFHVSRVYQCNSHVPSGTQPALRYSYIHAHHFSRFQNLKNPSTPRHPYCRDLTSLCLRLCIGVKLRAASGPAIACHMTRAPPLRSVIGVFSPLVRFSTHSTESHTNEGVPNILIRPVVSAVGPCPKLIRSSVLGPRQPPQKPNRVPRHVTAPLRPSTSRGTSRDIAR